MNSPGQKLDHEHWMAKRNVPCRTCGVRAGRQCLRSPEMRDRFNTHGHETRREDFVVWWNQPSPEKPFISRDTYSALVCALGALAGVGKVKQERMLAAVQTAEQAEQYIAARRDYQPPELPPIQYRTEPEGVPLELQPGPMGDAVRQLLAGRARSRGEHGPVGPGTR